VGDPQVPLEREYTRWAWHLEYQVGVVGHRHELGAPGRGSRPRDTPSGGCLTTGFLADALPSI
jgi:hypothetical protein